MSNIEQALKSLIEALEYHTEQTRPIQKTIEAIELGKSALAEIEKCEPVAKLGRWMIDKSTGTDILTLDNCSVIEGKYANYIMGLLQKEIDKVVSELENTSPQPRDWVGLTDKRIEEIAKLNGAWQLYSSLKIFDFVANINDELKQLNTKG